LAFENERLQAEARAQLAELRASRARLVAASDAERRRLERDLHDGAQQRLIGLTLAMRLMRPQVDREGTSSLATRIATAEAGLGQALDDLRELASGIHPAVLTDYGLVPAILALGEQGTANVRLVTTMDERFSPAAEIAAYLVVAEAAKVGPVHVAVERSVDTLVIEVDVAGGTPRLADVEDRVGALDGTIHTEATLDGVRIRVEIPCE
jgi:signal transduction histidine kinase